MWLSRDPLEEDGGLNLYSSCWNDMVNAIDPDGLAAETVWDIINVGVGAAEFACSAASGNVLGMVVDGAALAYDTTATAVPFLPGGASMTVRIVRYGSKLKGAMYQAARRAGSEGNTKRVIRWLVAQGDHAHHLLPHSGPGIGGRGGARDYLIWLNKGGVGGSASFQVKKAMDDLRRRAKNAGFDLHSAENGVSLPGGFHLSSETLSLDYYRQVLDLFQNASTKAQFDAIAADLAETLMKRSGKLK